MIPVEEALAIVLQNATRLPDEEIDFSEATDRLLREDVTSDIDMPPFPRSAVDGYAVRASDLGPEATSLKVVGTVPAGTLPSWSVGHREAAQIMTGAPVPDGADAVQMVEQTREIDGQVEILKPVEPGRNIAPRGSEVRRNDVVLLSGTRLDPPAIAVLATVGKTKVRVGRRPSVSVVATGDELVSPSETPGPGQIRNSNGFSLQAQCRALGAPARYLGVALDSKESLTDLIRAGLEDDVLLLSGGVSMGRFDFVEEVLAELGVRVLVDAVALKPGKPLVFGVSENGKLVFGLPGNPVSTMVTFELFVRAAIARMEGAEAPTRALVKATLQSPISSRGPRRAYLPGWLCPGDDGELTAFPIRTRGSGDIVAFSKANALLIVPEECNQLGSGDVLRAYPLDSFLSKEDRWQTGRSKTATL